MESRPITFVVSFVNFFSYLGKDVNGIFCIPKWTHRKQLAQMHAGKGRESGDQLRLRSKKSTLHRMRAKTGTLSTN